MLSKSKRKAPRVASPETARKRRRHSNSEYVTRNWNGYELGESGNLCSVCKDIDLDLIFQMKRRRIQSVFVCEIRHPLTTSLCPGCQFFAAMANPPVLKGSQDQYAPSYHLRAYSALQIFGTRSNPKGLSDSTVLAVVPGTGSQPPMQSAASRKAQRYILCAESSKLSIGRKFVGAHILPNITDFGFIRNWIDFCRSRHSNRCNQFTPVAFNGFKVINIASREIVDAPIRCSYVALSYVWGQTAPHHYRRKLPASCPAVVEDAMKVAQQLHFEYVWIDRYCIDQTDQSEKHNQIANMDLVYANADLTVVAAAGVDSTYGLPGVGSTPRASQLSVRFKNCTLVSSLENPVSVINASRWMSRGWTYQEGLLSRRRLIFTEQQVYFQCLGMHCFESISMPLGRLHGKYKLREDIDTFRLYPNISFAKKPEDFMRIINEYAQRSLSYDSDILNAISGVFKVFEQMSPPIRQLIGVPLFQIPSVDIKNLHSQRLLRYTTTKKPIVESRSLAIGLSWTVNGSLSSIKRRSGFPSWSYAGWLGWKTLHFPNLSFHGNSIALGSPNSVCTENPAWHVDITCEDSKGRTIPWLGSDGRISCLNDSFGSIYFLQIACPFIDMAIQKTGMDYTCEMLTIQDANILRKPPSLDLLVDIGRDSLQILALLLFHRLDGSERMANSDCTVVASFLLVQWNGKYYTRIGTASIAFRGVFHTSSGGLQIANDTERTNICRGTFKIG